MYYFVKPAQYEYIKKSLLVYSDYYYCCARYIWRYVNPTTTSKLPDLEDAFFLRPIEIAISHRCKIPENSEDFEKFQNIKSVFSSYNYSMKGNGSLVEFDIFQALNEINILSNQIMVIRDEKTHHGLIFLKENYTDPIKKNEILTILADFSTHQKVSDIN